MAIRMTSTYADELFSKLSPITAETLTEQHLDMLMMLPLTLQERADLADAADGLRTGKRGSLVVTRCADRFNAELSRRQRDS